MNTRTLLTLRLTTAPTQNLGAVPKGTRTTFPITGGTFEGPAMRGVVLPGGSDWTLQRPDGVIELDLRVTLQTHDGALIHMTFEGIRRVAAADAADHYFQHISRFETSAPAYAFLNRLLAVGTGELVAGSPVHVIEELL
jgi:Protein of unknown function (DUF3237)